MPYRGIILSGLSKGALNYINKLPAALRKEVATIQDLNAAETGVGKTLKEKAYLTELILDYRQRTGKRR